MSRHSPESLRTVAHDRLEAVVVSAKDPMAYEENVELIRQGIEKAKLALAHQLGKSTDKLSSTDLNRAPILFLAGQSEFLGEMLNTAQALGYPLHRLQLVDAGVANNSDRQREAIQDSLASHSFTNILEVVA